MELTQKGEMVSRLQAKAGQIGKILNNLEKYNHILMESDKKSSERKSADKRLSMSKESALKRVETIPETVKKETEPKQSESN